MNIGFIGLGKLGLPVALAIESKGHEVRGYDVSPNIETILKTKKLPYIEQGANEILAKTKIKLDTPQNISKWADIVFVAVQTPHDEQYSGATPLPETRKDFDYTYLKEAVESVKDASLIVVISTVLPGTIEREILLVAPVIYNPFFIAMGTTIKDFLNPEFVLVGNDTQYVYPLIKFYNTINDKGLYFCSIKEAEVIKVSYNTFITAKICIANTIMELCHRVGADSDTVTEAMSLATDRIISSKYLRGGMGDGGACHPRDNIALSWLAKELGMSYNLYDKLMECRERQTEWLANLIYTESIDKDLPIVILGKAFKANTNITTGSPAILLTNLLKQKQVGFINFDPHTDEGEPPIKEKAVYFIATMHDVFKTYKFPEGSVVIDVWGEYDNATIKIGR